jgi:hypothetical protein
LNSVRIGADSEINVRRRDSQIAKESIVQRIVVVLAGVHNDLRQASLMAGSMDRRKFRKVRTRTHNVKKLHVRAKREVSS